MYDSILGGLKTFNTEDDPMKGIVSLSKREDITPDKKHRLDSPEANHIHQTLLYQYHRELIRQESHRTLMSMWDDFVDHMQWSPEEIMELNRRGQAATVFNLTALAINWMRGTQRRAEMDWKILARTEAGTRAAEHKTALMKHVSDVNNSDFQLSQAFEDILRVGISFIETAQGSAASGRPVIDRHESWRNIVWDSVATDFAQDDARYQYRTKWIDRDFAEAMHRDRRGVIEAASRDHDMSFYTGGIDLFGDEAMDSIELASFENTGSMDLGTYASRDRLRLIEAWFTRAEPLPTMKNGDFHGQVFDEWSEGHWRQVKDGKAKVVVSLRKSVWCAMFTKTGLLSLQRSPYRHGKFPFTPVWGNRRKSDNMPYGMVAGLVDINRDMNKRMSKSLHLLSSRRLIVETGSIDDLDKARDEAARPDAIIEYKAGTTAPKYETDTGLAAAHLQIMQIDAQLINDTSGVTGENLGQDTNAISGKAILAKQSQGSLTSSHYFENLRFAKRVHGEKILSNVEQFYEEEFSFRITDVRGNASFQRINSPDDDPLEWITMTKADFIVSEADWRATYREAQANQLIELFTKVAQTAPQVVVANLDLIVDALDIPNKDEIVKRIRSITGATDPDEDPNNPSPEMIARAESEKANAALAARAQDAELALIEAKAADAGAKADKTRAEADKIIRSARMDAITAIREAISAAVDLTQDPALAAIADQVLAQAEADILAQDAAPLPMPPIPMNPAEEIMGAPGLPPAAPQQMPMQ